MKLETADALEVRISVSHREYQLLIEMVENRAEHDHGMILEHPELLAGFREGQKQLTLMWQEGAFTAHDFYE